jgi:hypothetical protein
LVPRHSTSALSLLVQDWSRPPSCGCQEEILSGELAESLDQVEDLHRFCREGRTNKVEARIRVGAQYSSHLKQD